jgi:HEAT repeat protein
MTKLKGLARTMSVLAKINNDSAVPILVDCLDASDDEVRRAALKALLHRRTSSGHRQLLERWDELDSGEKEIIADYPSRFASTIRETIVSEENDLSDFAFEAVVYVREYDLLPALVSACEKSNHPHHDTATQSLLLLSEMLQQELSGPRNYKRQTNPRRTRKNIIGVLEASIQRYSRHNCAEILKAFLLLAGRENSILKHILQSRKHDAHNPMVEWLGDSTRSGVLRLLASYLEDADIPAVILKIISQRSDLELLQQVCNRFSANISNTAKRNLSKIDSLAWLSNFDIINFLDEQQQSTIISISQASGVSPLKTFGLIKHVVRFGKPIARKTAASRLIDFQGSETNKLIEEMLNDSSPEVVAIALKQLRRRGIPGAVAILIERLDSVEPLIREAALSQLSEFNIKRFLTAFDLLDYDVQRSTGALVKQIDENTIPQLEIEFQAQTRLQTIRAIEVVAALDVVGHFENTILQFIYDEDYFIRSAAVRALGRGESLASAQTISELQQDPNAAVREAANQAEEERNNGPYPMDQNLLTQAETKSASE